jgi:glycosyltransferase involved in cell wall biosynthesis
VRQEPVVVFAGRFIPEKRVDVLPPALACAQAVFPCLRGELYGDGPERKRVEQAIADAGVGGTVRLRGFVRSEEVQAALAQAACMVLPSRREGYGLVVVEAASYGTPSVVVAGPDNAAVELVDEGVNGFIAQAPTAEALASAIVAVHNAGQALRDSTANWFAANARNLSLNSSLAIVIRAYESG